MGPGLGPQGKLEGLCVGSFNNCFGKFVPFFNGSGKKAVFIYISPATRVYKFQWVVISCLAFLLPEVIWNFYCQGAIYDLIQCVNLVCFLLCSNDGHFSSSSKLVMVLSVCWLHFLTKLAALLWTFAIDWMFFCVCGSHTDHAYSKWGLTKE